MELSDLVGLHKLSGVDFSTESIEKYGYFQDCQCINFVLDGITYTAVEDPDDGYRSIMEEIKVSTFKVKNKFKPVRVLGMMHVNRYDDTDDIIHFVDVSNGKVVLSVGTDTSDGYYPCFVSDWQPENLSINQHTATPASE